MHAYHDLVIIGAGPAGMSAAIEARKHGLDVLVLDRQPEPGGQIYKSLGSAPANRRAFLGKDYTEGLELVRQFAACGAEFVPQANVWAIAPNKICVSHEGKSHMLTPRHILMATGGMERPVPVPGWTEPGVLGAGAADVLLKSEGLVPEGPVILCGNGPLLLQSAVHLAELKVPMAGIVFTGRMTAPLAALPHMPGALLRPAYLTHGMLMGMKTLFSGAKSYFQASNLRIAKEGKTFTVTFTSLGKSRSLQGTTVLLHEGVVSENRITRLARCRHTWNAQQRYWHVDADDWGVTSRDGLFVAGDCAGIYGVAAAQAKGKLAALHIACLSGVLTIAQRNHAASSARRTLFRCKSLQPFMDHVFAPVPENLQPADEAIVCRCEELTAAELRQTIQAGVFSQDGLKAQARPGMGMCQGRMCSLPVAEMIAQLHGIPLERLDPYHAQAPLAPLSFKELAEMDVPPPVV